MGNEYNDGQPVVVELHWYDDDDDDDDAVCLRFWRVL